MLAIQKSIDNCIDRLEEAFKGDDTFKAAQWLYSYFGLIDQNDNGGAKLHLDIVKETLEHLGYGRKISYPEGVNTSDMSLQEKVDFLIDNLLQGNACSILGLTIGIEDLQEEENRIQQKVWEPK
ncbi:MAG: hypothetical protein V3T17_20220 [Pseudomonadales bacterium]